MRSSLTSLGRRLPGLTSDLALLADMLDSGAPDTLDKARSVVDKAVCAICREENLEIDAYTPVDTMLKRLVDHGVIPPALADQVRAVHERELTLVGDAVRALVGFLEWRVGSRARLVYRPPPRRSRALVIGLVVAIAAVGVAIAYVAWPRAPAGELASGDMIRLAGGTFDMGSHDDELAAALALCRDVEHRTTCQQDGEDLAQEQLRSVTVTAFELDRHEVTVGEYVAWLAVAPPAQVVAMPFVEYDVDRHAFSVQPDRATMPITGVTWGNARDYCAAVHARLPTEAEWEFAARGTARRTFPWGDALPACREVVYGRLPGQPCDRAGPWGNDPMPVESAPLDVTPEGIHDLGGNISEWTADAAGSRPRCSGPCDDPRVDGGAGDQRVVRGGSWMGWIGWMRAAARVTLDPDTVRTNLGFRCAR